MGAAKQMVVTPLGIITTPKNGVYPPGSMKMLQNACIRNRMLVTSFPAPALYQGPVTSAGYAFRGMWSLDDWATTYLLMENAGTWHVLYADDSGNGNLSTVLPAQGSATFGVASAQLAFTRNRAILTTLNVGPVVFDSELSSARNAGFSSPLIYPVPVSTTDANAISNGNSANWCLLLRRVSSSDQYEVTSEPSNAVQIQNHSGATIDPVIEVHFAPSMGIAAGDYLDLYRTKQVSAGNDPGTVYFLSVSVLVTSGMVAGHSTNITDRQNDSQLGQELYANPGRPVPAIVGVGGAYVNTPPGEANDAWVFRQQAMYATTSLNSYFKFRVNSAWGVLSSNADRTNGIGSRAITGDTVISTQTVNNVNNMRGVVVGQVVSATQFVAGTKITAIGANSFTVSASANATQVGASITVYDVAEINGTSYLTTGLGAFVTAIGGDTSSRVAVISSQPSIGDVNPGPAVTFGTTVGTDVVVKMYRYGDGVLTIRATNPQNYSPSPADIAATATNGNSDPRTNRIQWSKPSQPEAVPPQQELEYGNGIHYRGIPTKDCVWLFASDGLWRLSGLQDNYRVDPIDPTLILASRNAVCVLNQTVYAYTTAGLVRISAAGQVDRDFAFDRVNDLLPGAPFSDTWSIVMTADTLHREVYIKIASFFAPIIYNEFTDTFYYVGDNLWQAATYSARLKSVLYGYNDRGVYKITDATSTQTDNVTIDFQPLLGDGNTNTLKQWVTFEPLWEGLTQNITGTPTYDGTAGASVTVGKPPVTGFESRTKQGVPRSVAIANGFRPGLVISGAGVTGQKWKFRGYATLFSRVSDDMGAR